MAKGCMDRTFCRVASYFCAITWDSRVAPTQQSTRIADMTDHIQMAHAQGSNSSAAGLVVCFAGCSKELFTYSMQCSL